MMYIQIQYFETYHERELWNGCILKDTSIQYGPPVKRSKKHSMQLAQIKGHNIRRPTPRYNRHH